MASGYDISASTSSSTATNSASGPATSGGISFGNLTFGGGSTGLFTPPSTRGAGISPAWIVAGLVAVAAGVWYISKKKA